MSKTAIIGGGAAGIFLAICLKEIIPQMEVIVFEKSDKILSKLAISGGGRCNCTNSFSFVKDLSHIYPRGHRLMKQLFNTFSPKDAYKWFISHGIDLKTEADGRIFPSTDDSYTIINRFLYYVKKYDIKIRTNHKITNLNQLNDFEFIAITVGGCKFINAKTEKENNLLQNILPNNSIIKPIPSLFGLKIEDNNLKQLSGLTIDNATVAIQSSKIKANGKILITHQGISGPCILKLSSYGAVTLNEQNYKTKLKVNWINLSDNDMQTKLNQTVITNKDKLITNYNPFSLPQRFWQYLLLKIMPNRLTISWKDITKKEINRLINILCNDEIQIVGRVTNKEEFVTCGGVSLKVINHNTMQLKNNDRIFFAGEVLDIDAITGGYNFQAAWTTAYIVAKGIQNIISSKKIS